MATPLVAGMVALLKAQDPNLTGAQIRALLQTSGAPVKIETACNCRLDALNAMDHLLSKKPWLVPAAATMNVDEELSLSPMNLQGSIQFSSSSPETVSVTPSGVVRALKAGVAQITATDGEGRSARSLDFVVLGKSGGGGAEECPYSPVRCQWTCRMNPSKPYCKK